MCADISMCQDTQCPSREECYRFTAKPSANQSFQDFNEFRAGQDVCEDFVPNGCPVTQQGEIE